MHLYWHLSEVQLQRCTIVDRVLEGIFRHIASMILICTKALKGILISFINRCTCQSKEEGIGQCQSHTLTKVSLLCTMCLIHQYNDVLSGIQRLLYLAKQEDCCNQYLALVLSKELLQFFASIGKVNILDFRARKVASNLVSQIYTVIHDYNCRSLQFLHLHQLLCSKYH